MPRTANSMPPPPGLYPSTTETGLSPDQLAATKDLEQAYDDLHTAWEQVVTMVAAAREVRTAGEPTPVPWRVIGLATGQRYANNAQVKFQGRIADPTPRKAAPVKAAKTAKPKAR